MVQTFVPSYSLDPRAASPVSYISNPMAISDTSGWVTYADAAGTTPVDGTGGSPSVTLARTLANFLRGSSSFLFTKDAANRQGQGVSTDFTIDSADQATVLQIAFDYNASSGMVVGSSADLSVWIYDKTNAILIPVAPFQLQGNGANNFNFKGIFQTNPNSTSYRLIIHIATTSATAWTLTFDNVSLGPQTRLFGSPVTDWQSYSLTILGSSVNPTKGTVSIDSAKWRRVGDSMEITYSFVQTGAGSAGTGDYIFSLPPGYSVDLTKITADSTSSSSRYGVVGSASADNGTLYDGIASVYNASGISITVENDTQGPARVRSVFLPLSSAAVNYSFHAIVPIVGWSSTVLMSNDTDTRVVACRAYQSANQTITAGGGFVDLQFNLVNLDTHGAFNTSTFSYVVPVSGVYQLYCQTLQTANVNGVVNIDFVKNGTPISEVDFLLPNAATATTQVAFRTVRCVAGDILKVQYRDSGVGNATIFGTSPDVSYFEISRLSGPSAIAATETVAFRRRRTNGSNQTVPTATVVPYEYDSPDYDTHNAWRPGVTYSGGSGTWVTDPAYIIPVSGKYHFDMRTQWGSVTYAAGDDIQISISKNGTNTTLDAKIWGIAQTTSQNQYNNGSVSLNCIAGDVIRFMVRTDHSGGNTLTGNILEAWVDGERVGN